VSGGEVLQEPASGEGVAVVPDRQRSRGHGPEPRLQHAVSQRPVQEAHARHRHRPQAADPPGLSEDRRVLRLSRPLDHPDPGDRQHVHLPRHDHQVLSRPEHGRSDQVGGGRISPDIRQAQAGMTIGSSSSGPEAASPRAAAVSITVRARPRGWFASQTSRRLAFGYLLLAPAVVYVLLLVGAPFVFTLPISISVLGWKWMYDSQFSVINWFLSRIGVIGTYGSADWPVWLGQPHLALAACIMVNVWRNFPFSAIVLLAGFTSVPTEVLDAARVDGTSFFQRFRHVVVPMIAPILLIGFLFDTVFTLSDLGVVYLLTQGG